MYVQQEWCEMNSWSNFVALWSEVDLKPILLIMTDLKRPQLIWSNLTWILAFNWYDMKSEPKFDLSFICVRFDELGQQVCLASWVLAESMANK